MSNKVKDSYAEEVDGKIYFHKPTAQTLVLEEHQPKWTVFWDPQKSDHVAYSKADFKELIHNKSLIKPRFLFHMHYTPEGTHQVLRIFKSADDLKKLCDAIVSTKGPENIDLTSYAGYYLRDMFEKKYLLQKKSVIAPYTELMKALQTEMQQLTPKRKWFLPGSIDIMKLFKLDGNNTSGNVIKSAKRK